jgi:hypothetical protein
MLKSSRLEVKLIMLSKLIIETCISLQLPARELVRDVKLIIKSRHIQDKCFILSSVQKAASLALDNCSNLH